MFRTLSATVFIACMVSLADAEVPKAEAETSTGEGDLSSEQGDVIRATSNDSTVDDEANLIG